MASSGSKAKQAYAALYKSSTRWATNRKIKLTRVLKQQPNNEQIKDALANIKYRRHTPNTKTVWSHGNIRIAKLFKEFTGRASADLFSSNPKVQSGALAYRRDWDKVKVIEGKVNFSLGARAHDSKGNFIWK
jgi:hypothetical protein